MKLTNQQILDKFSLTENQFEDYKWKVYSLKRQHKLNKKASMFDIEHLYSYSTKELFNYCWDKV